MFGIQCLVVLVVGLLCLFCGGLVCFVVSDCCGLCISGACWVLLLCCWLVVCVDLLLLFAGWWFDFGGRFGLNAVVVCVCCGFGWLLFVGGCLRFWVCYVCSGWFGVFAGALLR